MSKDDEQIGESTSIETQRLMLTRFCHENQLAIVDYYVGDGLSGLSYDRPDLLSKKRYAYTTSSIANTTQPLETMSFSYTNANWKDQLTAVNGKPISYDNIGNPTQYSANTDSDKITFEWEKGRQLKKMVKTGEIVEFKYNENGLRIQKVTTSTGTTNYTLHGKNIVHMTQGSNNLHFFYDASNKPAIVEYNGTKYAYVHNLQGDIVAILDSNGTAVVQYKYDAWGKPLSTTGTMANSLGKLNPFRYRGYVYDEETGLYYVSSRYFCSKIGRWINADNVIAGAHRSILGYNVFECCFNSPVNMSDSSGHWPQWIKDTVAWANENVIQPISNFFLPSTNTIGGSFQEGIARGSGSLTAGYSEFSWRLDDKIKSSGAQDGWIGGFGKVSVGNANGKIGIGNDNLSVSQKCVIDGLVATAQAGIHLKMASVSVLKERLLFFQEEQPLNSTSLIGKLN